MRLLQHLLSLALLLLAAPLAAAHGAHEHHEQIVLAPDADWATRHMAGTVFPSLRPFRTSS